MDSKHDIDGLIKAGQMTEEVFNAIWDLANSEEDGKLRKHFFDDKNPKLEENRKLFDKFYHKKQAEICPKKELESNSITLTETSNLEEVISKEDVKEVMLIPAKKEEIASLSIDGFYKACKYLIETKRTEEVQKIAKAAKAAEPLAAKLRYKLSKRVGFLQKYLAKDNNSPRKRFSEAVKNLQRDYMAEGIAGYLSDLIEAAEIIPRKEDIKYARQILAEKKHTTYDVDNVLNKLKIRTV